MGEPDVKYIYAEGSLRKRDNETNSRVFVRGDAANLVLLDHRDRQVLLNLRMRVQEYMYLSFQ